MIRALVRRAIAAGVVLLALAAAPASAHRLPEVTTEMVRTSEDGAPVTQITHMMHRHDAGRIMAGPLGIEGPSLEDPEDRAAFLAYVADAFVVTDGERTLAPVTPLGLELEGDFVFVFQEVPGHVGVEGSTLLKPLSGRWMNHVNMRSDDGETVSYTFSATTGETVRQIEARR